MQRLALCVFASGAWILWELGKSSAMYNYNDVMDMSFMFFDSARSGWLPPNFRIYWRGHSGVLDQTRDGRPLHGGFYDAGDTTKYGLPMATAFSFLSWGLLDFHEGYRWDQQQTARGIIRWATDYLIKCHTGKYEFYAQVGSGEEEHRRWARPEDLLKDKVRVGYVVNTTNPGSDVVGASAAAMASAAMVFQYTDPGYSNELKWRAKQLYNFGNMYQGFYSDHIPDAREHYRSTHYRDDLAWAAMWLHFATGEQWYIGEAKKHIDISMAEGVFFHTLVVDWNFVGHPACLLLYRATREYKYKRCVETYLDRWIYEFPRTKKGLSYVEFGKGHASLRDVTNSALLALAYARDMAKFKEPMDKAWTYECWALQQIRYILGDGGRSYVVGYGKNSPKKPHHRGSSCPTTPFHCDWWAFYTHHWNPNELMGALVGGPDKWDQFWDDRTNFRQSEVALDYNAAFTGALARLNQIAHTEGFWRCYSGTGWL